MIIANYSTTVYIMYNSSLFGNLSDLTQCMYCIRKVMSSKKDGMSLPEPVTAGKFRGAAVNGIGNHKWQKPDKSPSHSLFHNFFLFFYLRPYWRTFPSFPGIR